MLRITVISLFVANLLLLGFQASEPAIQPGGVAPQTVIEGSNIPTIHLYRELLQEQELMSGSRQCYSLGPFHTIEDKDAIHAELTERSLSISERQTQALVEMGYWLFLPPYGSRLEAGHELLFLQELGLDDLGVIEEGEWENGISLGYFLRQENARERIKELKARGYTPSILVRRQAEPRYWLDIEQKPGTQLIELDMSNHLSDFMQRSLPCLDQVFGIDSPAPHGDFPGEAPDQDAVIGAGVNSEAEPERG
jgi:hypothetical protein